MGGRDEEGWGIKIGERGEIGGKKEDGSELMGEGRMKERIEGWSDERREGRTDTTPIQHHSFIQPLTCRVVHQVLFHRSDD